MQKVHKSVYDSVYGAVSSCTSCTILNWKILDKSDIWIFFAGERWQGCVCGGVDHSDQETSTRARPQTQKRWTFNLPNFVHFFSSYSSSPPPPLRLLFCWSSSSVRKGRLVESVPRSPTSILHHECHSFWLLLIIRLAFNTTVESFSNSEWMNSSWIVHKSLFWEVLQCNVLFQFSVVSHIAMLECLSPSSETFFILFSVHIT